MPKHHHHHHHHDMDPEEREKKRKKQQKRMGKVLGKLWGSAPAVFQESIDDTIVDSWTDVGQKLDRQEYKLGKHGWQDFAKDLGGVLNRHIQRKSKHAALAKKHMESVQEVLGAIHADFAKLAAEHIPESSNGSKRKAAADAPPGSSTKSNKKLKKNHSNKSTELAEREVRAMEQLSTFVQERGAHKSSIDGFRSRVTRKGGQSNRFDVIFFNSDNRRFRSMLEVGRFLKIVKGESRRPVRHKKAKTSREQDTEKKKIRRELERLRKQLQRASKSLDDFRTTDTESKYPIDDRLLLIEQEEAKAAAEAGGSGDEKKKPHSIITRTTCAAARIPDNTGFPGIPKHCIPDVLMVWDFLCTFERALGLAPIALDDFASAMVYTPPAGQMGDDVTVPPVFLAEAHLGLLKLLFQDRSSDDWWWSTLETDETEGIKIEDLDDKDENDRPVIKINMTSMLAEVEDPLITNSWLTSLEKICDGSISKDRVANEIRTALKVVSNKWVAAYLRKSLEVCKISGADLTQKAIRWLVRRVRAARPDLGERSATQKAVLDARAKVVEETTKQLESLGSSAPAVTDDDAISDFEVEEEESDEESEDEDAKPEAANGHRDTRDDSERPASALPPKPLPTTVDLLLPPAKPAHNSEFVDSFTWPHLVGVAAARYLHRKKRLFNEIDDSIRESQGRPRLVVSERREREKLTASRILTECIDGKEDLIAKAAGHLCKGGNYLELSPVERLGVLRMLIESAYDTIRVYEVVSGNYKQRISAMKALEVERRRAKREAKEKAAADEAAAREQLAADAREKFLDEKREEIRQLNAKSKEFPDDVIESLTDEDIIDFDEDIKADYEALPAPESFNKTQVVNMITRLQEEAAFDTDVLRVLTLEEIVEREARELEEVEGQFAGFGGEEALMNDSLDRETVRAMERLRRDIDKARRQAETLPEMRAIALEQLKDAMEDGTIKVLRAAYNAAKKAKLVGTDDETGGVWAVDLMRDAALELEKAKQNKRVIDAQRDLVAKRNRCFIRTDPMGRDRFGNRFWMFGKKNNATDQIGRVWVETELSLKKESEPDLKPPPGFLNLSTDAQNVVFGAPDMEEDFAPRINDVESVENFRFFSRQEYHTDGFSAAPTKHHWGCHASEDSMRALIKGLDSKGIRENDLRTQLKESVEEMVGTGEKQDDREAHEDDEPEGGRIRTEGDEAVFIEAKDAVKNDNELDTEAFENLYTGIGASVRVRQIVDASKDPPISRYENGTVNAWRTRIDHVEVQGESYDMEIEEDLGGMECKTKMAEVPLWRVASERGHTYWLFGQELMESLSRHKKWKDGHGYFEHDSAFFSYRNAVGRHCGKAVDAPYAASPYFFAKLMMKREAELYPKLKTRSFDNSWGGQSGARAMWTNSMKDYAYDFETVRQGLLTLENAFFELTGQFLDYKDTEPEPKDIEALLKDPSTGHDIELESIEKSVPGLWNSPTSRAVYLHIVRESKTTGFLALALDLLCRNTNKYLVRHKLLNARAEASVAGATTARTTRRMNAWQQQQQEVWF